MQFVSCSCVTSVCMPVFLVEICLKNVAAFKPLYDACIFKLSTFCNFADFLFAHFYVISVKIMLIFIGVCTLTSL